MIDKLLLLLVFFMGIDVIGIWIRVKKILEILEKRCKDD